MAKDRTGTALPRQVSTPDESALRAKIADMMETATKHYGQFTRSHEQLRSDTAKIYLIWRDAADIDGLLDSLFAERGIEYRRTGNRINFTPVCRYFLSILKPSQSDRVHLSMMNRALQKLHEHYIDNLDDFRHNAEGKLTAYIQEMGGIAGLAGQQSEPTRKETPALPISKLEPSIEPGEQTRATLAQIGLAEFKTSQGIGTATMREPPRVGADGLSILLVRSEASGDITILGSSNDPAQIDAVAASMAGRNLSNLPPNLRVLAEIILTQRFPPHALPSSPGDRVKWFQTHYLDGSDLWEEDLNPNAASD